MQQLCGGVVELVVSCGVGLGCVVLGVGGQQGSGVVWQGVEFEEGMCGGVEWGCCVIVQGCSVMVGFWVVGSVCDFGVECGWDVGLGGVCSGRVYVVCVIFDVSCE